MRCSDEATKRLSDRGPEEKRLASKKRGHEAEMRCMVRLPLMLMALLGVSGVAMGQAATGDDAATTSETVYRRTVVETSPYRQPAAAQAAAAASESDFEGYDFGHVVNQMESSVHPLQREMDASFRVFLDSIEKAEAQLDEGRTRDAVQTCAAAIDAVLVVREDVLEPIWEGQAFLNEQIGQVRIRLARAVASEGFRGEVSLDAQTESMLDRIALRIAEEKDPLRKARLVSHYRTVRSLAHVKLLSEKLSPDQRKLWGNVLRVLEEASTAHQQLLMGTEVLFAQLEATSTNLKDYLKLIDTVDGASQLVGMVNGIGEAGEGMAQFAQNMQALQSRLSTFNRSVEAALEQNMQRLDDQVEALGTTPTDTAAVNESINADAELGERLKRLTGEEKELTTTPGSVEKVGAGDAPGPASGDSTASSTPAPEPRKGS